MPMRCDERRTNDWSMPRPNDRQRVSHMQTSSSSGKRRGERFVTITKFITDAYCVENIFNYHCEHKTIMRPILFLGV